MRTHDSKNWKEVNSRYVLDEDIGLPGTLLCAAVNSVGQSGLNRPKCGAYGWNDRPVGLRTIENKLTTPKLLMAAGEVCAVDLKLTTLTVVDGYWSLRYNEIEINTRHRAMGAPQSATYWVFICVWLCSILWVLSLLSVSRIGVKGNSITECLIVFSSKLIIAVYNSKEQPEILRWSTFTVYRL